MEEFRVLRGENQDSDNIAQLPLDIFDRRTSVTLRIQDSPMCISSAKSSMHLYRGPSINRMQRRGR